jgi:endonuclease/exonuclease/phosphatase (EEP) superfamily protein YafD
MTSSSRTAEDAGSDVTAAARGLDRWFAAAAAVVVVCSLMPLAARWGWAFELTTHFRLQYLIAALGLTGVLCLRRRFAWCAPLLLTAAISAGPLAPYLPTLPAAAVAGNPLDAGEVTVVSVNVWKRNTAYERLLDIVADASPDVLLVVEYDRAWAAALEVLRAVYPHRLGAPREGDYGIALFSRHPLEDGRRFDLEGKDALDARVLAPQGAFRLVGVHLTAPTSPRRGAQRNRQLEALAALRAQIDEPLLMMGDFNVTPFSPYFRDWLAETGLRDTAAGRGPAITWPAFFPLLGIPIDHCLVSPELEVTEYRRLPAFGSDHYPVLARFLSRRT